jgi:outer membrane lipopolysaccharide assembly protein LptE/RlpB
MRTILLMAVFLVAACGWLDDVHLRNPETTPRLGAEPDI